MGKRRNLRNLLMVSIVSLFFLSTLPSSCSTYYADIDIQVDNVGIVTITGKTNHPELLVQNSALYTYKKQSYWLLNITYREVFSDFLYTVTLPQGSIINYIKSSSK